MIPELNDALFDSWLLEQFPGRTLDELDNMDIFRYLRSMEARNLDNLETMRKEQTKKGGKLKASDISQKDWKRIKEHDEIIQDFIRRKGK